MVGVAVCLWHAEKQSALSNQHSAHWDSPP